MRTAGEKGKNNNPTPDTQTEDHLLVWLFGKQSNRLQRQGGWVCRLGYLGPQHLLFVLEKLFQIQFEIKCPESSYNLKTGRLSH